MTQLKIDGTTARKEYASASPALKAVFEKSFPDGFFSVDPMERIQTFRDCCELAGKDHDVEFSELVMRVMSDDEVAYRQYKIIVLAYNACKKPDFTNSNKYKHYAWVDLSGPSGFRFGRSDFGYSASDVGSRLCFLDDDHVADAFEKFPDIMKRFYAQ